jgi:Zn-dependent protease with chaperone function
VNIRLPDAPSEYDPGWAAALVSTLTIALASLAGPQPLPGYTVATLPSPKLYERCLVYVIDGAGNKRVAVSTGAAWRYLDGVLV